MEKWTTEYNERIRLARAEYVAQIIAIVPGWDAEVLTKAAELSGNGNLFLYNTLNGLRKAIDEMKKATCAPTQHKEPETCPSN